MKKILWVILLTIFTVCFPACSRPETLVYEAPKPETTVDVASTLETPLPEILTSETPVSEIPEDSVSVKEFFISDKDGVVSCICDINNDGESETIYADYSATLEDNQVPVEVKVVAKDENILWTDWLAIPHTGWKYFYIVLLDNIPYMIEYFPPEESQGLYYYSYKVFNLDKDGNVVVFDELSGNTQEGIEAFNTAAAGYLDKATLFISIWDFKLSHFQEEQAEQGVEKNLLIQKNLTAAELFASVLQNETKIYFSELAAHGDTELFPPEMGTISELQYGYGNHYDIANFAVVDLDGDSIPEVILEVEEYFGYIILRYQDGCILGSGKTDKGFMNLKEDGRYESTGGAAYGEINRLYFMGKTWEQDNLAQMDYQRYYRKDMVCDETVWKLECDEFKQLEPAEWYAFTPENIDVHILNNEGLGIKASDLPQNVKERQVYLDSLSYLQEITYDLYKEDDGVYRRDAVDYYNGCLVEMDKILSLCKEKEDAQGLVELEKEQQLWQENFDRRLQDTLSIYRLDSMEDMLELDNRYLYFSYGDMMLRRTLRLVDRYYDASEYE